MRPTVRNTLVLTTVLAASCVFAALDGVAPSSQLPYPAPGLLTISQHNIAVTVDRVPVAGPTKTYTTRFKAFNAAGTLLASDTLANLKAAYGAPMSCDRVVSLSDGVGSLYTSPTTDRIVMHCDSGVGYYIYVPRSGSGTLGIGGEGGGKPANGSTRDYTDFAAPNWDDYATRTQSERMLDAALFTSTTGSCTGSTPFLAWSNGFPLSFGQTPIDLRTELGCTPKSLRLSVDETRQEWAILADNKLIFMEWDAGTTPTVTDRVTLASRYGRSYVDVAYRHGQVAIAEQSWSGNEHIFLMDRDTLTITDNVAVNRVEAVEIHGPGDKTAPYVWFTGRDITGAYGLGRLGLLPDP